VTHAVGDGLFERVLDATAGDGAGAELYERRGALLELTEDEEGSTLLETHERGLALRLFKAGRSAFAASGAERASGLPAQARSRLPRARARRGVRLPAPAPGEAAERRPLSDPPPPDADLARTLLTGFRQALTASGHGSVTVREASVSLGERVERLATSSGRDAAWGSRMATLVATVVGRSTAGRFSTRVVGAASRAEELPVARLARHAADRVLLPLRGRPFEAARADVLLDPLVAAHLVGRLAPLFFGDDEDALLSARTREGRDAFASPLVSLVDDATAPGGLVRGVRDGEGTLQGRSRLVDRGLPFGRLTDVAAAGRLSRAPSGNAVRMAWSAQPRIGVTNFFVDPSPGVSPLDLLGAVSHGLYAAVLLERPEVDLAADRFRLVVAGYAVERGRATERISEGAVSGRLSDFLRGIAGIGDDLKFTLSASGSAGSPTLLVPRWKTG
jgi:predicted Zn-dependent protease